MFLSTKKKAKTSTKKEYEDKTKKQEKDKPKENCHKMNTFVLNKICTKICFLSKLKFM